MLHTVCTHDSSDGAVEIGTRYLVSNSRLPNEPASGVRLYRSVRDNARSLLRMRRSVHVSLGAGGDGDQAKRAAPRMRRAHGAVGRTCAASGRLVEAVVRTCETMTRCSMGSRTARFRPASFTTPNTCGSRGCTCGATRCLTRSRGSSRG